ncbi:ccch zinc finger DNA-binding protein [Grosmannia clavigera kw1407]|uniref:Ccch zinc finger DNA-binding protein n=1 Tax=Grosmannia clavigera (strain kw1407 / UAMH 11150) TaxID=655863 RepID=F0XD59_GROCL|nr:ccch zinc finger DNA-binding protein [Grosmannia clavigera kw1407]EFX04029.1 ccch zinc finger DNA-binding protein [Grosmannia clavigera kw1407]
MPDIVQQCLVAIASPAQDDAATMERLPVKAIDFDERFAMLRYYNDNSSSLIEDLITYCKRREASFMMEESQLRKDLHDAELDLKHATKSRRDLQEELRLRDVAIEELQKSNDILKVRTAGDAHTTFKEEFIKQGIEGGKKAASALRAAIASVAKRNINDQPDNIEVVATVYANLAGLAGAMRRAGWLASTDLMRDFTQGFTQTKASFDFIDVGYGKERADSKIRGKHGAASWHLKNPNCKMLALGISHDSGYAPFLDEIISVGQTRDRIVILEGSPTVPELVAAKVAIHKLTATVFHNEKLVAIERTVATSVQRPAAAAAVSVEQGRRDSSSSSSAAQATPQSTPPAPATIPTTVPPSYTTRTTATPKASPPPKLVFPSQTAKQLQQREAAAAATAMAAKRQAQAQWNPGPRGLDSPITYSMAVVESVRMRPHKLCNKFVLLRWCPKGDSCPYVHPTKPSADEVAALTYMSRVSPCTSGQDCDVDDCIYGHHCPSVQDGYCMHPYCKFEEHEHPPHTKFRSYSSRD